MYGIFQCTLMCYHWLVDLTKCIFTTTTNQFITCFFTCQLQRTEISARKSASHNVTWLLIVSFLMGRFFLIIYLFFLLNVCYCRQFILCNFLSAIDVLMHRNCWQFSKTLVGFRVLTFKNVQQKNCS